MRKRHAFEGQTLAVISSIKRRSVLLVLVILPNGSRSLIPAAWTDWRDADVNVAMTGTTKNTIRLRSEVSQNDVYRCQKVGPER